jgi:hypothetical protein
MLNLPAELIFVCLGFGMANKAIQSDAHLHQYPSPMSQLRMCLQPLGY